MRFLATGVLVGALAACGGGSSPFIPTYTIGGTVTGLEGSGLVLRNNAAGDLEVSEAGAFAFTAGLANGTEYAVTVKTQPSGLGQNCTVTNGTGSGIVATANVTNVAVVCVNVGRFAYVANQGDPSISVYSINPISGALTAISGSPFAAQDASYLALDPAGKFLYAVAGIYGQLIGFNGTQGIVAYAIDTNSGALTQVAVIPTVTSSVYVEPNGRFVYVPNDVEFVSAYTIDAGTGGLTEVAGSPFVTSSLHPGFATAADPGGHFLYVGGGAPLSAYAIDPATGVLTTVPGSPFGQNGSNFPTVDGRGKFLYSVDGGSSVSAYSLNAATGELTAVAGSPFTTAMGTWSVAVKSDPSGTFLFVANQVNASVSSTGNNISVYTINATTGALTAVAGSPFAAGKTPSSLMTDPSGKFLYVTNQGDNTISAFTIAADTGVLTPVAGSAFTAGRNPLSITI